MKRYILAGCVISLVFPSLALPGGTGKAKVGGVGNTHKVQTNGVGTQAPLSGQTSVADSHRDLMVDHVGATLGGVGHAVHHAASSAAGVLHHPPGWNQGKKTGWKGSAVPPGQAKKAGVLASDITRREVANFDRFLDSHPALDKSLSQNPSLVNNATFLAQNPALSNWLKAHPNAASELRENPQAFLRLEQRFDGRLGDITRGELARFDNFLDANPSIAADLHKAPSLVNNSTFLAQNPALSNWLKTHPQAAAELRENPEALIDLEQRFEARQGT